MTHNWCALRTVRLPPAECPVFATYEVSVTLSSNSHTSYTRLLTGAHPFPRSHPNRDAFFQGELLITSTPSSTPCEGRLSL